MSPWLSIERAFALSPSLGAFESGTERAVGVADPPGQVTIWQPGLDELEG